MPGMPSATLDAKRQDAHLKNCSEPSIQGFHLGSPGPLCVGVRRGKATERNQELHEKAFPREPGGPAVKATDLRKSKLWTPPEVVWPTLLPPAEACWEALHKEDSGKPAQIAFAAEALNHYLFQSTLHLRLISHRPQTQQPLMNSISFKAHHSQGSQSQIILLSKRQNKLCCLVMFDSPVLSQAGSLNAWRMFIFQAILWLSW